MRSLISMIRRVPWWVWALLAPTLVVVGLRLAGGQRETIAIVGSGPVSYIVETDAPEGVRYELNVTSSETLDATEARVRESMRSWPSILVVGVDPEVWIEEPDETHQLLERVAEQVESAATVIVMMGPADDLWFRSEFCQRGSLRICVENPAERDRTAEALAVSIAAARERHRQLRASTQRR